VKAPNIVKSLNQAAGVTKKFSLKMWKTYVGKGPGSSGHSHTSTTNEATETTTTDSSADFGVMFPSHHRPPPLDTLTQDFLYEEGGNDDATTEEESSDYRAKNRLYNDSTSGSFVTLNPDSREVEERKTLTRSQLEPDVSREIAGVYRDSSGVTNDELLRVDDDGYNDRIKDKKGCIKYYEF